MRVAYHGAPGAFGHQACLAFLGGHRPEPRDSFRAVAEAVARNETERGILPLENSRAGTVAGVRALIEASGLVVLDEPVLPVRMHLLALPGVALAAIGTVVSHEMALKQCARSIAALGLETELAANTALAARALRARDKAVLASEAAAAAYGLAIVRRDMHDDPDNATRFAVLGRAAA